ncbi:TIGR00725 family protein [Gracilimonas sp.]|uniref:TIGR00725 family protein n=1 Tax=Gracilimonas sp. TaxID=1974203 RepID=UPI002871F212|nr:TIGR00725 family protein [Gracilimonas sp.]
MEGRKIIGIMGPGEGATTADIDAAFEVGQLMAESGYLVLTGGRASGVMEAAMKGAKSAGGTTIGILPSEDGADQSEYVDIPIKTGMGSARNNINVLTSDTIIGIGVDAGTISEIALAIKANKLVLLLNWTESSKAFFENIETAKLTFFNNPDELINYIQASEK